jgi:hypothetical protein
VNRQSEHSLRSGPPSTLHFDALTLINDIVIDAGGASLGEEGAQAGMPGRSASKGRGGAGVATELGVLQR